MRKLIQPISPNAQTFYLSVVNFSSIAQLAKGKGPHADSLGQNKRPEDYDKRTNGHVDDQPVLNL